MRSTPNYFAAKSADGEPALLKALAELLGTKNVHAEQKEKVGNIGHAIDRYLKVHTAELKNGNVKKDHERMFAIIKRRLAQFDVDQIMPGDILDFLQQWADKPTARRSYKARLSGFFAWCVLSRDPITNKHCCAANPCREIKLKSPTKRKATITSNEIYHAIRDKLPPIG